jgi:hypothetical protein
VVSTPDGKNLFVNFQHPGDRSGVGSFTSNWPDSGTIYRHPGDPLPPVSRTVEVLRNGAQAYGSAQSYALKQFLRSLFLIPTGDADDADLQPTDAGTVSAPPRQQPKPAPTIDPAATDAATSSLLAAGDLDQLRAIWSDLPAEIKAAQFVIAAKDKRKAELEATPKPSDDLDGDEIPY